jgi:hypothetical protein
MGMAVWAWRSSMFQFQPQTNRLTEKNGGTFWGKIKEGNMHD